MYMVYVTKPCPVRIRRDMHDLYTVSYLHTVLWMGGADATSVRVGHEDVQTCRERADRWFSSVSGRFLAKQFGINGLQVQVADGRWQQDICIKY